MPSKAIMPPPETRPGGSWRQQPDTGPSAIREDNPKIARAIAVIGAAAIIVGGMALGLQTTGRFTPLGTGWSTFFLMIGLAGLLFHAAFEGDVQWRRVYMAFAYLCLVVGGFMAIVPFNKQMGALFGQGYVCMFLGLLFLLAFLRNEDDAWIRRVAENVLGGVGAVLVIVGLGGGTIKGDFMMPIGLLLSVLGLIYLTAFVGSRGIGDDWAYRAGLGIGGVGALVFVIALGRSVLPPLFHRWHWTQTAPEGYFVPYGALLMGLGGVYVFVSLLMCSDNPLLILTRRELGSLFYSPIAYVLLFVFVVAHWWAYFWPMLIMLSDDQPLPEPIIRDFILQLSAVISTIVAIPVLTMRLLSEEKRTGTLEVLLTAPVDEGSVIVSKFLAAFVMYLVMWIPFGLFLAFLRVAGGSPFDYRPLFSFTIGQLATGAAFVAMGVFFSSLTRNQVASGVLTFGGMLSLTVIYFFGRLVAQIMASSTEPTRSRLETWQNVIKHMSYIDVWFDTLDGRLYLRQVIFFASLALVWLFLSVKVLEARKWA
jgi:ABC-type transport system involved in multi-copper enzyme maturation permease subunit